MINLSHTDDDFPCVSCSDKQFIAESERQGLTPLELKMFERNFNINLFCRHNHDILIRFI
jgi:hypothetical protein